MEPSVSPARRFGEVVLDCWSLFIAGGEVNILSSCRSDDYHRWDSFHSSTVELDRRLLVRRECVENFSVAVSLVARPRRASAELEWDSKGCLLRGCVFTIKFVHYREILIQNDNELQRLLQDFKLVLTSLCNKNVTFYRHFSVS